MIEAGAVRFRPIALTAAAVVIGGLVMVLDPIFQGLAVALMFGAVAATALTMVLVPLLYWELMRRRAAAGVAIMKLVLFLYLGPDPERLHALVEGLGLPGHTDLGEVHGAGRTGRHEGTRAFPGGGSAMFSVVADAPRWAAVMAAAGAASAALPPGERLHAFVLPVEQIALIHHHAPRGESSCVLMASSAASPACSCSPRWRSATGCTRAGTSSPRSSG